MIPKQNSEIRSSAKYFILEEGDIIHVNDEYYNNFKDEWLPVEEDIIGDEFKLDESKPVRRLNSEYESPSDKIEQYVQEQAAKIIARYNKSESSNITISTSDSVFMDSYLHYYFPLIAEELKKVGFKVQTCAKLGVINWSITKID